MLSLSPVRICPTRPNPTRRVPSPLSLALEVAILVTCQGGIAVARICARLPSLGGGNRVAGCDPCDVTAKAARVTFKQIFRDGFFHADVHPGNLFVTPDGVIAAVDFGIMGRLDIRTRRVLGEMLLAFLMRDYRRAAEVHFEAGWIPADQSVDAFTQAC